MTPFQGHPNAFLPFIVSPSLTRKVRDVLHFTGACTLRSTIRSVNSVGSKRTESWRTLVENRMGDTTTSWVVAELCPMSLVASHTYSPESPRAACCIVNKPSPRVAPLILPNALDQRTVGLGLPAALHSGRVTSLPCTTKMGPGTSPTILGGPAQRHDGFRNNAALKVLREPETWWNSVLSWARLFKARLTLSFLSSKSTFSQPFPP